MFRPYGSEHRATGVSHFALLPGAVLVVFRDGPAYLYTADATGAGHVAQMQQRAVAGRGLSTYISQHVGDRYAQKLSRDEVMQLRRELKEG